MIMSSLARKVFDQTDLFVRIDNAWWVERRLQQMQINGLVKMINQSKKKEVDYIDGYAPKFGWASRTGGGLNIADYIWLYELVQCLDVDYPWGMWGDLLSINLGDINAFKEASHLAKQYGKNNLPYVLTIVIQRKQEAVTIAVHTAKMVEKTSSYLGDNMHNKISKESVDKWQKLKDMI